MKRIILPTLALGLMSFIGPHTFAAVNCSDFTKPDPFKLVGVPRQIHGEIRSQLIRTHDAFEAFFGVKIYMGEIKPEHSYGYTKSETFLSRQSLEYWETKGHVEYINVLGFRLAEQMLSELSQNYKRIYEEGGNNYLALRPWTGLFADYVTALYKGDPNALQPLGLDIVMPMMTPLRVRSFEETIDPELAASVAYSRTGISQVPDGLFAAFAPLRPWLWQQTSPLMGKIHPKDILDALAKGVITHLVVNDYNHPYVRNSPHGESGWELKVIAEFRDILTSSLGLQNP